MPHPKDITLDKAIYPVLAELSACLCNALGDTVPCFCGLTMGDFVPTDFVGHCESETGEPSCGAAYVRIMGAYPTENFPEPIAYPRVNSAMAYQVAVGVLRCVAVGEDDGSMNPDDVEKDTLLMLSDMKAIRSAIACCLQTAFPEVDHVLGIFTPIPQEGDVAGGEWPVTLLERF